MRISDSKVRARVLDDLRALADFLHAHPNVPIPEVAHLDLCYFPGGTEDERVEEVNRVADLLNVVPRLEGHQHHYVAERRFGSAAYRVVAIPDAARARSAALNSYADNIHPH